MNSFGEDLRMERVSRGIALEQITAVTKISQQYLIALEQERFRLLPAASSVRYYPRLRGSAVGPGSI